MPEVTPVAKGILTGNDPEIKGKTFLKGEIFEGFPIANIASCLNPFLFGNGSPLSPLLAFQVHLLSENEN